MSRNFQSATAQLTHVVQLARAGIHSLEQLVDLLVAHLLAQVREDVAELADADEAREFLVEDLEAAAVLLGLAGVAEAAGAVEDAGEVVEVDCRADLVSPCVFSFVDVAFCSYSHRPSGSQDP